MKTKRIIVLILVLALTVTTLIGCSGGSNNGNNGGNGGNNGGDNNGDSTTTLKISAVKLGYGVDWLKALGEAFKEKTGVKVEIVSSDGSRGQELLDSAVADLTTDSDLVFNKFGSFARYAYTGKIRKDGVVYDNTVVDLSDVWNGKAAESETKTIKEKMNSAYTDYFNVNNKYYGMPWAGGVVGIVRNLSVWNNLGLTDDDVPLTTDQLFALCDNVRSQGAAPFIFSTEQSYYESFMPIFMAQYEGAADYAQFLQGKDPNGEITANVYDYKGAEEAMKIAEKLIRPVSTDKSSGYQSTSSDGTAFAMMQSLFLQGEALFCVNGSWLEIEASTSGAAGNIDYIRTPVISSIIDRLSTVSDDSTLVKVIEYIDAIDNGESATKPSGVSDDDIAIVTEARHYSYITGGVDHQVVIPSNSKNIQTAKNFLRFMYSDEGLNIYYKALKGNMLPATPESSFDSSVTVSDFMKSSNKATEMGFALNQQPTAKYYVMGGVSTLFNNGSAEGYASKIYHGDLNTAGVLAANKDYIKNTAWSKIEEVLGL